MKPTQLPAHGVTPQSPRPLPATGGATSFASRLPIPQREPAAPPVGLGYKPRLAAFSQLVSSACYLSLHSDGQFESVLEAIQILHDCSQEMLREGLDLGDDPNRAEDQIWNGYQYKWEGRKAPVQNSIQARSFSAAGQASLPWGTRGSVTKSHTEAKKPYCESCNDHTLQRVEQKGFIGKIYAHFGLFPWECAFCRKVTMRKDRDRQERVRFAEPRALPWRDDPPPHRRIDRR